MFLIDSSISATLANRAIVGIPKRPSTMKRTLKYLLVIGGLLLGSHSPLAASEELHFDLVVYGATPSGVVTAVAAAREGLQVAIVEPGHHVGGMVSGGLDTTDRGNIETIGGIPREFFERVGRHYNESVEWDFEPHVAEQVFKDMLHEAHVAVFFGMRLREAHGVTKSGARIASIITEDGSTFSAKAFADCSYEGDLMVQAGVANTWGREASSEYHESYAGVIPSQRPTHQFNVRVSPYAADGSLLPGVSSVPKGDLGQGDKKIPAFNFRMCFTADKSNQVPYPKPEGYDPRQYELLARLLAARTKIEGHAPVMKNLVMRIPLKGGKFDINNEGAFSTDDINANWDYPNASYRRREEIAKEHYRYQAGYFYFLANDPRVPASLQKEFNLYGLAKDEFTDSNNWPFQLYVREDHRMMGEYVTTQHDILEDRVKADSIGMGSYQMDSHNVQRVVTPDGAVENEGDMYVPAQPWELSYRSLVPKRADAVNLLVPVCISASHAAYGTFRTEPVMMIAGQATGVAVAIAVHKNLDVQDVSVPELQKQLLADRVVLHWPAQNSK